MARAESRSKKGGGEKTDYPTRKLISPPIRLSYPSIFDPRENDQGQDVWETDALVPPDKEGLGFIKKLEDALYDVMEEHFGPEDEWPRGRNDYEPKDKIKYMDPDKLPGAGITEDWQKFTARSYSPVGIVDADRNEVLNKREAYGGRWARLSLTVTVYDNKSKGPTIYLNNVQLLDNDESFGGRPRAEEDFDNWEGSERGTGNRESRGRGREESRTSDDRGRGGGRGSRDDDARDDRSRSRSDREERGSDRRSERDSRDSRGRDDRDSRGRDRDADRSRDRGDTDRDRGSRRDRGDERDSGARDRGSREEGRGRDRDERQDRGRTRDADSREDRGSRGAPDRDRGGRDRGRGGRDDEGEDDRPSRSRGRDDRGRDDDRDDEDWN